MQKHNKKEDTLMQQLYEITSKIVFRNGAHEKLTYSIFIINKSKEKAKELAIEQFRSYMDDMRQSFNKLEKMLDDRERADCYNDNPGLSSLHHAANGDVDITELGNMSPVATIQLS